MIHKKMHYYQIDVIRFMAALFVMWAHYLNSAGVGLLNINSVGQLGVHVFFIVSGYVISITATNSTPKQFIIKRAIRLYPAMIICMLLSTFIIISSKSFGLIIPDVVKEPNIKEFFVNISLLNKFIFNSEKIDIVLWTIAVEVKFYIFITLALCFVKDIERLMFAYGLFSVVALSFTQFNTSSLIEWGVYFAAGSNFHYSKKLGWSKLRIALSLVYLFFIECHIWFNFYEPKMIAMICFFIIYLILSVVMTMSLTISDRWAFLTILGGASYPLYLIHNNMGRIFIENDMTGIILMMSISIFISLLILKLENKLISKIKGVVNTG